MNEVVKWSLLVPALGLFAVSFFLPAYREAHFNGVGWECALVCLELLEEPEPADLWFWYYALFNVSNLAMVVIPVLLVTVYRRRMVPLAMVIVQGSLLLHVLSWPVCVWSGDRDGGGRVLIGYYLWLLSMIIVIGISLRCYKSARDRMKQV